LWIAPTTVLILLKDVDVLMDGEDQTVSVSILLIFTKCPVCESNLACDGIFNRTNSSICDKSYVTHQKKLFSCKVTAEEFTVLIGNYTLIQCADIPSNATSPQRGTCDMQVFDLPSMEETFYCHLSDCYSKFGPGDLVTYECSHTSCNCSGISPKCQNEFVIFVLAGMHGSAQVQCDDKTKQCTITRTSFLTLYINSC
jgi:hypothetical protein